MKKELSAYLDLLRVLAALTVFVGHLSAERISGGFLWQTQGYGHSAVIIFFVLSGFVISYSSDQKEKTLFDYSVARFARIYSVVIPAIAITALFDWIGILHNPEVYYLDRDTMPTARLALGALFLSQSWQKVDLLSNDPFWSLPYEFWYYQIFAAFFFLRGHWRILMTVIACLCAGPAILLFLPLWLLGVVAYRFSLTISRPTQVIWSVTAVAVLFAIYENRSPAVPESPFLPTAWSILDYVIGVLLALNIVAASQLNFGLSKVKGAITYFAGMSFALYLLHFPLMRLASAYTPTSWPVPIRGIAVATFTLLGVYILSFVTERQKRRWRKGFAALFSNSMWPRVLRQFIR